MAVKYCETAATPAKLMSMPPNTMTTRRPQAKIAVTA